MAESEKTKTRKVYKVLVLSAFLLASVLSVLCIPSIPRTYIGIQVGRDEISDVWLEPKLIPPVVRLIKLESGRIGAYIIWVSVERRVNATYTEWIFSRMLHFVSSGSHKIVWLETHPKHGWYKISVWLEHHPIGQVDNFTFWTEV